MALHLHRAARTDQLADQLGELLASPLADPFAAEVVVVPAKGVERWLSQRLSHRLGTAPGRGDGVCAGVDFRSPRSLFAVVSGRPDADPWAADALAWPLLRVIDASIGEPWAATLARHLGHDLTGDAGEVRKGRRFATARRLAGLFASYAAQRPGLIADWAAGRNTDGAGEPIPDDLAWQPELWRRVAGQVAEPDPTRRQAEAVARLGADPTSVDLPSRVNLFGHTRLAACDLVLLEALAADRDVHLWLPHSSTALWSRLTDLAGVVPRVEDRSHLQVGHPLLATLGRDTRELQRTLGTVGYVDEPIAAEPAAADSLLGWLQADLRANAPSRPDARALRPDDRSVQLHACHGPARQVDVLREVVLGLLADDPTLEPRDVLVMCPDIESYAPLLSAAFGLADVVGPDGHPAHRLRVSLADRALDQTNPLLAVVARLLDLAGGRAGVGAVLDLAHAEPVRHRFGLRDDDLDLLATWVQQAGVKWGFDAAHREAFGLEQYDDNTWRAGLDRLLAGVALSDDSDALLGGVLPLDDVGSGDVDLIGRLAELVARLEEVTDRLVGTHPLDHWLAAIEDGVGALTSVRPTDSWQLGQVQRELDGLRAGGSDVDLRLPDVRAMFSDRLAGRPTRANFRTGVLTVSTLVPMRSVPHRVVCLLGLDDGIFPRVGVTDGDDVLARRPLTGERDPRSEDRQLLLDAVLAATDTLVITYTGANEFTGQPWPPAVPVGELLDALDLTATAPDGPVRDRVTVRHPLQPFDRRNLVADALVPGRSFAFDRFALAGARAVERERAEPAPFLSGPLPLPEPGDVALDDLVVFFGGPVKGFLKQRLGIALPREDEPVDDRIPITLDALEEWAVGDRILGDLMRGHHPDAAVERERRRGVVPPGELGDRIVQRVIQRVKPVAREALAHTGPEPRAVDVDVDLGGGRRLRGTVPELYGDLLVRVSYSRLGPKHRLHSWIKLLALTASDEDKAWRGLTIGRPERARADFEVSRLAPLDHRALGWVRDLVAIRDEGMLAPLPLPLKTSLKYARARRSRTDASVAVDRADFQSWRYDGNFDGERTEAEHVLVWGDKAPLPGVGEPGEGTEPTRFGALAMRVWSPLLESEVGELVSDETPIDAVDELPAFDLIGPLPTGTTLLEASAGTGKTFTVGALVTRYVAEGAATLDEMLVITFSRSATQELRARVRDQLTGAERAIARQLATGNADADNDLLQHLLDAGPAELAVRLERLRDALAAFDSATIATTHQFCHVVLRSLGVASESDTSATLIESLDELVLEVVDDLYLADHGRLQTAPLIDRATAAAIGREAVLHQNVELAPADPSHPLAAVRADFARRVREEVERRKLHLGIQSYDDLLARLAHALEQDDAPARARMRSRWRIVLVDEFQDTDPVQWQVLERAFHGHSTLILIGDPKQAIYGFRGGDVDTYLIASKEAGTRATLGTNRRSDAPLVERFNATLGNAGLGSAEIVVRTVTAAHEQSRLVGAPHPAPFRIRQLTRDDFQLKNGLIRWWSARDRIAADLAGDVVDLLDSGATWCDEPVRAHHVAVLVATRPQGAIVEAELQKRGVPVVLNGGGDVFLTPAADDWLTLLKALDAPHRTALVRSAALTCFFGHDVAGIVAGGDALTGEVADELRDGAILVRTRGIAALVEALEEHGLSSRILGQVGGERLLTDLRHLGQLLHQQAVGQRLGLTALLEWFRDERLRIAAGERPRRLDSDARAVQIVTIHGSKGLEYPVVYLPYVYTGYERDLQTALFHDRSDPARLRRLIDVAGTGRQWTQSVEAHRAEEAGEELRKLYVALTRAQSQVVTWWAPDEGTDKGALNRILFGRLPGTRDVLPVAPVHDDDRARQILQIIERDHGGPTVEPVDVSRTRLTVPPQETEVLAARAFDREIDTEWRRTSYSGLIRVEEQAIATSEPEVAGKDDEPDAEEAEEPTALSGDVAEADDLPSPMADLPAGAGLGSLVHAVLEHADPDAPDLRAELQARAEEQLRWWPSEATADELADALLPMNATSLGPVADRLTLGQIPLSDRLRELDFEIPLAGGDLVRDVTDEVRLRDLAPVLRTHLGAGDPMAAYADKLELPPLSDQTLRGYLSGSIDAVLRLPSGRFVVVDYKTNRLGEVGRPITAADYAPARLTDAMLHSHYPLQALLYSVVVHRYLRWRLPGYDPTAHLGGILYLYVRGMCGPDTPEVDGAPCGVFSWQPPAALVLALSDLLDGGAR